MITLILYTLYLIIDNLSVHLYEDGSISISTCLIAFCAN